MLELRSFFLAAKAVWAQRLYNSKDEIWTIIPKKHMEQSNISLLMSTNIDKEKSITIKLPKFYQEVIFSWHSCGGGLKAPQSETEIRQQIIWGNKFVQSKNNTLFYFIVSGGISVYLVKIKVVSITSELISYHFTSD